MGSNHFQTGSAVIRVRTYGRDGRPILDNGRVPTNFSLEEPAPTPDDSSDDCPTGRGPAGIEPATLLDSSQSKREPAGSRRNTIGRKHSPSNAAAEPFDPRKLKEPEESMQKLTEKFESIRREAEELMAQGNKDSDEFKGQVQDLMNEKDEKRQALKEKEDASEKLRKDINIAESKNRASQNRKSQKEKLLRDKEAARKKMYDDMSRWKNEIEEMKRERQTWELEQEDLVKEKEGKTQEFRGTIRQRQNSLNGLEEEIHIKGLQIKELEDQRQQLPGTQDDDESRARDAAQRQRDMEWDLKEREMSSALSTLQINVRALEAELYHQQQVYNGLVARNASNPLMYHANSSGVDLDPTNSQGKVKSRRSRNRKSRTNTVSSPVSGYPLADPTYSSASLYSNLNNTTSPTFAPGPYFSLVHDDTAMVPLHEQLSEMTEADKRAFGIGGAPLSPTATALLPSNIFADDEPSIPDTFGPLFNHPALSGYDNDAQSPDSSSRSASFVSSPRSSAHNLAMFGVSGQDHENERRSLHSPAEFGVIGSPSGEQPAVPKRNALSEMFQLRARGKTMQDGHALGSLKSSQSQSFPRSSDEPGSSSSKGRRVSFSTNWNPMSNFFTRNSSTAEHSEGNGPAPARPTGASRQRGFNIFNRSADDTARYDRNPTSPRPASVASSELPRPSTDSGLFGWPAASEFSRNSPLNPNWSNNPQQPWSSAPSRRPSIQQGSTTHLPSGIASEDDDFLPSDRLTSQTSPPGVIGSRPMSSHVQVTPKLNPAAPAFMAMISSFTSKGDKDKSKDKGKEKADAYEDYGRPGTSLSLSSLGKMSRDSPSIRTQNSVSESHESLSLERTSSNTPSDMATPSATNTKEKEPSSFSKLMRKGSSSKFSLASIRRKESSLFSSKKAPGSASNSDRNFSGERDSSMDEWGENEVARDSVTSSPMIGSTELKSKDSKEGRMSVNWGLLAKFGKPKGRDSSDVDRSEAETTGDERD